MGSMSGSRLSQKYYWLSMQFAAVCTILILPVLRKLNPHSLTTENAEKSCMVKVFAEECQMKEVTSCWILHGFSAALNDTTNQKTFSVNSVVGFDTDPCGPVRKDMTCIISLLNAARVKYNHQTNLIPGEAQNVARSPGVFYRQT
jgi:hypothetical protein